MSSKLPVFALAAAAAALFVLALALGPTMIAAPETRASGDAPHSWVADAFPTGQAGFARADGARR